jgi:citrate-Mg2+:H+ or citrate-Ca2+:H+ symporter, CitMHS family
LLAIAGFAMVAIFMALIMTKRLTPVVALVLVPLVTALLLGTTPDAIGDMALDGVKALAPTGVMLMFAILYFGVMIDAGLFDPVVRRIVRLVEGDPLKVVVGTAGLAAFISLDGDGSTTYMITVAAMLPLYHRLGMNALNLTCVTMLASGVMNLTPWGGPLARAASALQVEPADVFVPMLPAMAAALIGVFAIAYYLGLKERRRLNYGGSPLPATRASAARLDERSEPGTGIIADELMEETALLPDPETARASARPALLWVNLLLTMTLMAALIAQVVPMSVLFIIGFTLALLINYPRLADQRERLVAHAPNAVAVVSIIFAAGIFTGILNGTGMVTAMSTSLVSTIPDALGQGMAPITALVSLPFTFFISNDAFYFGMLPILADAGAQFDVAKVEMARASLVGQPVHLLSPLVPSTFLLVGLAGVEMGDHQRFTFKWAVLICLILGVVAFATGAFGLAGA